jgi:hypothetical protein
MVRPCRYVINKLCCQLLPKISNGHIAGEPLNLLSLMLPLLAACGPVMQINIMTYENITSKSTVLPALMGVNAQLAAISRSIAVVFHTIIRAADASHKPGSSLEISQVDGIQDAIYDVLTRADGDGVAILTNRRWIRAIMNSAAKVNQLPKWKTYNETELRILFDVVATVSAVPLTPAAPLLWSQLAKCSSHSIHT